MNFIRRFEEDYGPRPTYLTGNYRSTGHIIAAANAVIEPARQRMKAGHPIHVNQARENDPPGGDWSSLDPVARGQVQILPAGDTPISQAQAVIAELKRLSPLTDGWDWSSCAVIGREWSHWTPCAAFASRKVFRCKRLTRISRACGTFRETRALVNWVRERDSKLVTRGELSAWLGSQPSNTWNELLEEAIREYELETGGAETPSTTS